MSVGIVGAVIGGVAAVGSAVISSRASSRAAQVAADGNNTALAAQLEEAQQQRDIAKAASDDALSYAAQTKQISDWTAEAARGATQNSNNIAGDIMSKGYDDALAAAHANSSMSNAVLGMMQGAYNDWNNTFGSLNKNLAHFYSSLSPEQMIATGVAEQRKAFDTAQTQVKASFAQRGIDSATQDAIMAGQRIDLATNLANLRYQAPLQVAKAQSDFVTTNGSMTNPNTAGLVNASTNAMNAKSNLASTTLAKAQSAAQTELSRGAANTAYFNALAVNQGVFNDAQNAALELRTNAASRASTSSANALSNNAKANAAVNATNAQNQGTIANNLLNTGLKIGGYAMQTYQNNQTQPTTSGDSYFGSNYGGYTPLTLDGSVDTSTIKRIGS